jgi:hypothetical protein
MPPSIAIATPCLGVRRACLGVRSVISETDPPPPGPTYHAEVVRARCVGKQQHSTVSATPPSIVIVAPVLGVRSVCARCVEQLGGPEVVRVVTVPRNDTVLYGCPRRLPCCLRQVLLKMRPGMALQAQLGAPSTVSKGDTITPHIGRLHSTRQ